MVNQEYLEKFKRLYKDKYDIDLTDEEATELGTQFLNLMKVLTMPDDEVEDISEFPVEKQI